MEDLQLSSPESSVTSQHMSSGQRKQVAQLHIETESERRLSAEERTRVSNEFKRWSLEQDQKQPKCPIGAPEALASVEVGRTGRTRSMDLLRADANNIRLSIESANLPKHEKMKCILSEGQTLKLISSKDAFGIIASGCKCVITGFAFEHMIKVNLLYSC